VKKLALTAGAVLALSVMTAPVALAQDGTASCDAAKTRVSDLEKKLDEARADESVKERDALKAAKKARDDAKVARDAAKKALDAAKAKPTPNPEEIADLEKALAAAEDALTARKADVDNAQEKLDSDSQKVAGLRAQVELAIQERDKACAPATTTPTPTPTPEPENDVDCDEVSGTEAQRILDEDRNDPNNLDQDKDGIACEIDEILPDDDNDVVVNNNVAVPSGGVPTGGGPAWAFQ
jgi:chromosome segregation ATPase